MRLLRKDTCVLRWVHLSYAGCFRLTQRPLFLRKLSLRCTQPLLPHHALVLCTKLKPPLNHRTASTVSCTIASKSKHARYRHSCTSIKTHKLHYVDNAQHISSRSITAHHKHTLSNSLHCYHPNLLTPPPKEKNIAICLKDIAIPPPNPLAVKNLSDT